MVSDNGKDWKKRYFAYEKNGFAYCYGDGADSWSADTAAICWECCRKPTQEELEGD